MLMQACPNNHIANHLLIQYSYAYTYTYIPLMVEQVALVVNMIAGEVECRTLEIAGYSLEESI